MGEHDLLQGLAAGALHCLFEERQVAIDALARIEALTEEIKVGRIYNGTVSSVKDFGVFVEIAPGKDGLCHISELADGFVKSVGDICSVGDAMDVKVIAVDDPTGTEAVLIRPFSTSLPGAPLAKGKFSSTICSRKDRVA